MARNIYQTALDVQDASNMSGVIQTLANEIAPAVWEEVRAAGSNAFASHPAILLFLDKLNHLAGIACAGSEPNISEAYSVCSRKADQAKVQANLDEFTELVTFGLSR